MNLNKTKKILLIILSLLIATSIVILIYNRITMGISESKVSINAETVDSFIKEATPIRDYVTFFELNSACENFTSFLLSKDYARTYEVFTNKYKGQISAINYTTKIKEFTENYLITKEENTFYNSDNCLYKAFYYNKDRNITSVYICQIKTLQKDKYLNIAIRLIKSGEPRYEILYVGM